MKTLKSETNNSQKQTDTGRRSFIWKVGAGMSAVLAASVPGFAKTVANNNKNLEPKVESLSRQVGILEDEKLIRKLHRTYEDLMDNGMYNDALNLFTDDAEVIFNGGVFKGKDSGVSRLYCNHFRSGLSGKRIDPAPGFQPNADQMQDMIVITPDGRSAKARFTYSIQVGAPIISDSPLVKMAHLHGEGIMKWWEGGIYEISYVKDTKESCWKIKRLEYRVLSKADYRPGKSYPKPLSVPSFSKTYPENPTGPDRLITMKV